MNTRKLSIIVILAAILSIAAGAVSAQDQPPQPRPAQRPLVNAVEGLLQIVSNETGLQAQDILSQIRDGSTLADIITANGGSVDNVIAQAVSEATNRIDEAVTNGQITQDRADQILANLQDTVTNAVNNPHPALQQTGPIRQRIQIEAERELLTAAADATGLQPSDILQQMRDGSTLAQVIEANGGSVDAVVASAVASATERINQAVTDGNITQDQADRLIANLQTAFTNAVNNQRPPAAGQPNRPNQPVRTAISAAVLDAASQVTGLDRQAIVEQLRNGSSLADVLTANGVDVNSFIDGLVADASARLSQAVQNGRITQEDADARLQQLRDALTTGINESRPAPAAPSGGNL